MKKILLVAVIAAFCFSWVRAQETTEAEQIADSYQISVGPYVAVKGGINAADTPEGVENDFLFVPAPDLGVYAYFPFSLSTPVGAMLDLGYTNYAFVLKPYDNDDLAWDNVFHYFTIGADLNLYGFMIGMDFSIPLSGKQSGGMIPESEEELDSGDMNTLTVLKVGGLIPIVDAGPGTINLLLTGGYALNGLWKNAPAGFDDDNPHPAAVGLGVNYLFHVPIN